MEGRHERKRTYFLFLVSSVNELSVAELNTHIHTSSHSLWAHSNLTANLCTVYFSCLG